VFAHAFVTQNALAVVPPANLITAALNEQEKSAGRRISVPAVAINGQLLT
jgi:hypothetical protein